MSDAPDSLTARIADLARASVLLVATDFDGTVAPIVDDPARAEMNRETAVALRYLAGLPQTHVAVISGRALADLAQKTNEVGELHLIGSHGSEFDPSFALGLADDAAALLDSLKSELQSLAGALPGAMLETKPSSLAFHYRNADEARAAETVRTILDGSAHRPGVHVRHGKKVVELSVVETNKGAALERVRQRLGATAAIFIGDDVTDEDAFGVLRGFDVGVKVGPGETLARFRIDDSNDVARTLAQLAEARAAWLAGAEAVPIVQHSILSDQRTVAVVAPGGRIVWLCLPRIDSPALFAELLGGPHAGYFDIRPAPQSLNPSIPQSLYLGDTFILRTEWPHFTVTDYMDTSAGRAFQRAGRTDLLRVIEPQASGPKPQVLIRFAPRLDFGRIPTHLSVAEDGLIIEGVVDPIVLRAPGVNWKIEDDGAHHTATAIVELSDQPLVLELRYGTGSLAPSSVAEPNRRAQTERSWSGWAGSLTLPSLQPDLVRRSALVLKALTYGPTGAIAAAATTSLPEHAGGIRNWDYRYCWPRDAAMAAAALVQLGNIGPGTKFLDWVIGILEGYEPGALLRPVYTVSGGHLGSEADIPELAGYRGSRPVRVGNAAAQQVQLDVCGPIADLIAQLAEHGAALSSEHWHLVNIMVSAVAERWREPDHGIWEVRLPRRHHIHSKVMCWQTVDRGLAIARYLGRRKPEWEALRKEIADDVLTQGWNEDTRAFCGTYGSADANAATLSIALAGLLPATDPRFLSTVAHIERELLVDSAVYRYRTDDGLPGVEGAFNLCTLWLADAYIALGRRDEAHALFENFCRLAGPTGLLAEEYDPENKIALGNFPQAYSHLALIQTAVRLSGAG
ncbi:MAG TPA: trehalose-phosphatase [Phycisphaerae bacterium]|nr:trehalose-phosphatase [Phycisphaerae bacterium]